MKDPAELLMELEVASGAPLDVRRFAVREAVSEPFDVTVVACSQDASLDLEGIVGQPATFRIGSGGDTPGEGRRWAGICRAAAQEHAEPTGLSTYRFHLVPALWLMTQRRDHRIFRHQAAPAIAAHLLDLWGIEHTIDVDAAAHPPLPYKVQYGESDHAFFCRVLEEAGIAFTFPPGAEGHGRLTLGDRLHTSIARAPNLPWIASPGDAGVHDLVTDVRVVDESRPGAYTLRDHDLRRPAYRLFGEAEQAPGPEGAHEQYHYRPGAFLVDTTETGDTPVADDEGAMRHDTAQGRRRAGTALASERADKRVVSYRTSVHDLWPGRVFSVVDHPHPDLDASRKLLAVERTLEGAAGEAWTFRGRAVFADAPYHPPLRTPRPRARLQSAMVVGSGEIDTDELGRVRVHFPWDREESSTVWVRVSETWAGAGFGLITLPRVGQEVLVDFLEGDPEQPVIVGRVFNAANVVVEPLPWRETRSAWRSSSSPATGGSNEIRYEDEAGSEELYEQAERDERRLVKHDDTSTIVHDRRKDVIIDEIETTDRNRVQETQQNRLELTSGDRTTVVDGTRRDRVDRRAVERIDEGTQIVTVGKDRHAITAAVRREQVERDSHLTVEGSRQESVGGVDALSVHERIEEAVGSYSVNATAPEGWIHLMSGGGIFIESDTEVIVRNGGNFLQIKGGDVIIQGTEVAINDDGSFGSLPGAGPRLPEPPLEAVVREPPPPPVVLVDFELRLLKLTVVSGVSQAGLDAQGADWATVKKEGAYIVVEATTGPNNNEYEWRQINWGGSPGEDVDGKPNQRKFSRGTSTKYIVEAELGGYDYWLDLWVIWAEVSVLTDGQSPAGAPEIFDGEWQTEAHNDTHRLGVVYNDVHSKAEGRIRVVAKVSPAGISSIIQGTPMTAGPRHAAYTKTLFDIKRGMQGVLWVGGVKDPHEKKYFTAPDWHDDTSVGPYKSLLPDKDDQIYDTDQPDIKQEYDNDRSVETQVNFREWVVWNDDDKESGGKCSDDVDWYWEALGRRVEQYFQVVNAKVEAGKVKLRSKPLVPKPEGP